MMSVSTQVKLQFELHGERLGTYIARVDLQLLVCPPHVAIMGCVRRESLPTELTLEWPLAVMLA